MSYIGLCAARLEEMPVAIATVLIKCYIHTLLTFLDFVSGVTALFPFTSTGVVAFCILGFGAGFTRTSGSNV